KRTVIWPFYFYTIIRTLSDKNDKNAVNKEEKHDNGANNSEETKVK
ncbi:hypothetical protein ACEZB5_13805, partial [Staphylococcus aureus]